MDENTLREQTKKSLMYDANVNLDICETLRLTYDLVFKIKNKELKYKITEKLISAMVMGKKMADRLTYYKNTYNDDTGTSGKRIIQLPDSEKRKNMRRSREAI